MQISKNLIDFINDNENKILLNSFKFKLLYDKLKSDLNDLVGDFSALMYKAGLDPLIHMDRMPDEFLAGTIDIEVVKIPTNISSISNYAFECCSSLTTIKFNDTKSQWEVIKKGEHLHNDCPIKAIHCIDGDINLK